MLETILIFRGSLQESCEFDQTRRKHNFTFTRNYSSNSLLSSIAETYTTANTTCHKRLGHPSQEQLTNSNFFSEPKGKVRLVVNLSFYWNNVALPSEWVRNIRSDEYLSKSLPSLNMKLTRFFLEHIYS